LRTVKKIENDYPNKKIKIIGCLPKAFPNHPKLKKYFGIVELEKEKIKLGFPRIRKNNLISIVPIAEGCVNNCSFCAGKLAKGFLLSYPEKDILNEVKKSKTCAILGGGLVSLKMTQALSKKGVDIKILIRSPRVLSQVLDDETAYLVQNYLENNNVDVKVNTQILEIQEKDNKLLFIVKSGQITEEFEVDFAVIGKGVKPNIDFLEDTAIETDWGILTDEYLQTKEKDVYAVGDVAESYNIALDKTQLNSIWPDAVLQGIKAAENMAGKTKPYLGNINMNAVDIFSLPLVAMGRVRETENIEILRSINLEDNKFLKLFFKEQILVGAILIGDIENAGIYKQLIINRKRIHDSQSLLNQKNMLANYIF